MIYILKIISLSSQAIQGPLNLVTTISTWIIIFLTKCFNFHPLLFKYLIGFTNISRNAFASNVRSIPPLPLLSKIILSKGISSAVLPLRVISDKVFLYFMRTSLIHV